MDYPPLPRPGDWITDPELEGWSFGSLPDDELSFMYDKLFAHDVEPGYFPEGTIGPADLPELSLGEPKSIEDLVACPACGGRVHPPKGCPAGLVFEE